LRNPAVPRGAFRYFIVIHLTHRGDRNAALISRTENDRPLAVPLSVGNALDIACENDIETTDRGDRS